MAKKDTEQVADQTSQATVAATYGQPEQGVSASAISALAEALSQAIRASQPPTKKTSSNRKPVTAWSPKDGTPKLKLKRKMYQHGLPIDPDLLTNEEIIALNELRPGRFLNGWVKVYRRRDRGVDIDYPTKT